MFPCKQGVAGYVHISPTKKRVNRILNGVSGILKPSRYVHKVLETDFVTKR